MKPGLLGTNSRPALVLEKYAQTEGKEAVFHVPAMCACWEQSKDICFGRQFFLPAGDVYRRSLTISNAAWVTRPPAIGRWEVCSSPVSRDRPCAGLGHRRRDS